MLLTLSGVLSPTDLEEARSLIGTLGWRDGAETAGGTARAVKRNQQADLTSRTGAQLRQLLKPKLERHPVIRAAAQPQAEQIAAALPDRRQTARAAYSAAGYPPAGMAR